MMVIQITLVGAGLHHGVRSRSLSWVRCNTHDGDAHQPRALTSSAWSAIEAEGEAQPPPPASTGTTASLSANVRETAPRPKFSVEGEQAAARDDIIEPSPRSPALPDGSDVQGPEAALHRRVQEEGPAGRRRPHGARSDRRVASARGAERVPPGDVAAR